MGMPVAQFLALVCGEVDDRDAPARTRHARRFGKGSDGRLREMQHLVEQHRVETSGSERQRHEIALHQFDALGRQVLQLGTRDAQHGKALVERDDPLSPFGEEFRHSPGAGADIEQATERLAAERLGEFGFDRIVGRMQASQFVPVMRVVGEIGLCRAFAVLADFGEFAAVLCAFLGEIAVRGLRLDEQVGDCPAQRRRLARTGAGTQEHPAALAAALGKAGVAQYPDVARDARLALAEHLRDFAHRKLHRAEQAHDPEARGVGKGAEELFGAHRGHRI